MAKENERRALQSLQDALRSAKTEEEVMIGNLVAAVVYVLLAVAEKLDSIDESLPGAGRGY